MLFCQIPVRDKLAIRVRHWYDECPYQVAQQGSSLSATVFLSWDDPARS
jgi:hypothetical protein